MYAVTQSLKHLAPSFPFETIPTHSTPIKERSLERLVKLTKTYFKVQKLTEDSEENCKEKVINCC